MAGIKFDITADNSQFIETINQVQNRVRQTSNVLQEVGKNFNVDGIASQIISLTKLIQEQENKIRASKEDIVSLMEEANEARNKGDYKAFEQGQYTIEQETKKLQENISKLNKYRSALTEIMSLNGRETGAKAPMFFADQSQYEAYEELLRKREEIQSQLANFNNEGMTDTQTTARIVEMRSQLLALNTEINNTELAAAKASSALGANGQKASEAAVNYYELNKAVEEQIAKVNSLQAETIEAFNSYKAAADIGDVKGARDAQAEYENLKESLHSASLELINLKSDQEQAEHAFKEFGDTSTSLRMQLREATMELQGLVLQYRQMSAEEKESEQGEALKKKIEEVRERAGELRDTLGDVQKMVSGTASDTRAFDSVASGINVLTSSFGAATGVLAMFGAKEEDLQDIQAKLQASLAISNALTVVQNQLQQESALMIGVTTLQKKAATIAENLETAAKGKNVVATTAATVAQKAFNAVAKANPYVLLATALISVVGAIALFTSGTSKAAKAEEDQKRKLQEFNDELKNTSREYGENRSKLEQLQSEWSKLTSDTEKEKWLEANKEAFKKLGVEVDNVKDAENLLVNNTETYIKAMEIRAKAAAHAALATQKFQQSLELGDEANARRNSKTWQDQLMGIFNVDWSFNFSRSIQQQANRASLAISRQANKAEQEAEEHLEQSRLMEQEASDLIKKANIKTPTKETNTKPTKPTGGKTDNTAKEQADAAAKTLRERWKQEEEISRMKRDASDASRDAEIAAIKDNGERERAEQEEQHKRNLRQIQEQANEMKKAIYEHNKTVWENSHKDSPYELTPEGKARWSAIQLPQDQQSIIDAREKKENEEHNRRLRERLKSDDEAQKAAIYQYISTFGDYEMQKTAIEKKADDEIFKLEEKLQYAKTDLEKASINAQIELVRDGAKRETEELDKKFGKTAHALGDLFADASKKSIEQIDKIVEKYEALLKMREGKEGYDKKRLIDEFGFTEEELTEIEEGFENGSLSVKEFMDRLMQLKGKLKELSRTEVFKNLFEEMEDAFNKDDYGQGLTKFGNLLKETSTLAGEFGESLGTIFHFDKSEYEDLQNALNNMGSIFQGIGQIYSGDYIGGAVNTASGIAGMYDMVSGAAFEREAEQHLREILADRLSALNDSVQRLTNKLDEVYGEEAILASEEAKQKALEKKEYATQVLRDSNLFKNDIFVPFGGKAQLAYFINEAYGYGHDTEGLYAERMKEFRDAGLTGPALDFFSQDDWEQMLAGLSDEELAKLLKDIKENHEDWWAELINFDDGFGEEYLNAIIEAEEQLEEIERKTKEAITRTSFDSVFDSFMSSLENLANGSEDVFEDIADNWQKMVNKMVLYNLVGNKYKKQLVDWYDMWEKAYSDDSEISEDEIINLKKKYNDIVEAAMDEVEALRENGLIAATGENALNKDQSATMSAADKITYDQMEEFTGILTAVQIAGEQRLDVQKQILYTLQNMSGITSGDNSDFQEIRGLIGVSNDYLLDIKRSNREILEGFSTKMDKIINQLNNI